MRGQKRLAVPRLFGSRGLTPGVLLSGTSRSMQRRAGRPTWFAIATPLLSAFLLCVAGGCSSLSVVGTDSSLTARIEVRRTGSGLDGSISFSREFASVSHGPLE